MDRAVQNCASCGGSTLKRFIKGGVVVCKCRQCGKVATEGRVERAPESIDAKMQALKTAYEASLQEALRAKYDVMFNYAAEGDADVPALVANCLQLKKKYDRARQDVDRGLEVPNPAKLLAIDLPKQLNPGKTPTSYKAWRELQKKVWKIKYKVPLQGAKPPLARVWWFDQADL